MRRKILLSLLLLPLTACFNVDDFSAYWMKAGKDPQLAGSWKIVTGPGGQPSSGTRKFAEVAEGYRVSDSSAQGKQRNSELESTLIRTLTLGPYQFLLAGHLNPGQDGRRDGMIIRYKIEGDTLQFVIPLGQNAAELIEKNHPRGGSVKIDHGMGAHVRISRLDDEAASIVSSIPDTDEYCVTVQKAVRVR